MKLILKVKFILVLTLHISISADQTMGRFAIAHQVHPGQVKWTNGFLSERFESFQREMFPTMKLLMEGTNRSHYLENFKIAAGLKDGRSRGAPFNDGDFYKWMQSAIYLLAQKPNPELEKELDEIISIIDKAQRNDGYIHTPVIIKSAQGDPEAIPFSNRHNFELYNMGHLFTTASLHFRITGKKTLLNVAIKAADFLDQTFKQAPPEAARSSVCPSHFMGMIDLWRVTHNERYLRLVEKFFKFRSLIADGGDDNQDRIPFKDQREAVGHAVRANYLYAGAADLYIETGNKDYWKPLPSIWKNVITQKMYITGGCGALYDGASPDASKNQRSITRTHQAYGRNYQLPNTTAHNETCANIGNVIWNWRMFLASGKAQYLDVLELAFLNSVLSGVDLDGHNFFYTNPLRVTKPLPTSLRWSRSRVPFVSAFCCPPNVLRTIGESSMYAYAKKDHKIWVNLYGSNQFRTSINNTDVQIVQETDYPWEGKIQLTIQHQSNSPIDMDFYLRIPSWADGKQVKVATESGNLPEKLNLVPGSFLSLKGSWRHGDTILLDIPMPVKILEAHPLVEENTNQVAFKRGPLIYCLETHDLPFRRKLSDLKVSPTQTWIPIWKENLLGGVTVLSGQIHVTDEGDWSNKLYREYRPKNHETVPIQLVPYALWGNRGKSEMSVWLPIHY